MRELVPYLPIILGCILLATIFITAHVSVHRFNKRRAEAVQNASIAAETQEPTFLGQLGIVDVVFRRGQTGQFYGGGKAVQINTKYEKA